MRFPIAASSVIALVSLLSNVDAGLLSAFAIDPHNPQVQFAGADMNGLTRSVDGGIEWTRHHNGSVVGLSLDPDGPNSVFLGARLQGVLHLFFDAPGTAVSPATWGRVKNAYPLKRE